ncbi:hypothetical protein QPL79_08670 [Ignisphaera sp. 4213-co]|uniref:Uncharacterized protein n=1 Tax=Ignisphaera cupida TaxID=3050454 RepID=A0ABD4Z8A0_9CREN|nr:hypothetical protein [Ignisphaera sp. 4213-co]MDK6029435.1 hypothetical protein [Ignisphaera sp. 4213-co]
MSQSSIQTLLDVAKEICLKYNVLCINIKDSTESEKLLMLSMTWIENFFYIDPQICITDFDCVESLIKMHKEVFEYAQRGEYIINLDKERFLEAVEKLLKLSQNQG